MTCVVPLLYKGIRSRIGGMAFPDAPLLALVPSKDTTFDLPPKWDGQVIEWSHWDDEPRALCPTSKQREVTSCGVCGNDAPRWMSHGVTIPQPGQMVEGGEKIRAKRSGRTYEIPRLVPAHSVLKLFAYRCTACQHDTVYDLSTHAEWDLDASDYGVEGSTAPK